MNEKITIQDIPEEIRTEVIACRVSGYNKVIEAVISKDDEYHFFEVWDYGTRVTKTYSLSVAVKDYNSISRRTDVFDQRELITN